MLAQVVALSVMCLLAGGQLLLEDVPGVGKTTLARALGRAVRARVTRVQFTPDMLPSDLTGVSVWDPEARAFTFHPGPIFSDMVLADEVNRANPKTQSALLEAMEEGRVSVDGTTYDLDDPYFVMATQNPVEMEGTYPLHEAQLHAWAEVWVDGVGRVGVDVTPAAATGDATTTGDSTTPWPAVGAVAAVVVATLAAVGTLLAWERRPVAS